MAATGRPRRRVPGGVVASVAALAVVAVVVAVAGGALWSRTIGGDPATVDDDIVFDAPGEYVMPGRPANRPLRSSTWPAIELVGADGRPAALVPDGRPMVVNVWFSTCPPCARELADFAAVHAAAGADVRFVGLNPYDTAATMKRFAAERGVGYELWRDPELAMTDELGVVAFPVTVFVDADGTIVERAGALDATDLRARLAAHWGIDAA